VAGKSHGGGAVFSVCPGVGQGVHMDAQDIPRFIRTQADPNLHGMAAGGGGKTLLAGKDHFSRFAGFQGDHGRKKFGHKGLLGSESGSDPGFDDPDLLLGNIQGPGRNGPDMEGHLGGSREDQATGVVHMRKGPEGFHHGLVIGAGLVYLIHDHLSRFKGGIHVSVGKFT